MQLFRFDPEVSLPVTRFGSRFRIAPLTGPESRVQVQVMHLGADGLIGRHAAVGPQLLAVVAGHGWVSGHDGERRAVGPGWAVAWADGEVHETGTDEGLTAVCIEGRFDIRAPSESTS